MHKMLMTLGLVAGFVAGPSAASETAPETSIRPAQRSVATAITPSPIRPIARPQEAALVEIQISTSNHGFQQWVKGFRGRALSKGIKGTVFDQAFRGVEYDKAIIAKDRNQSEFTKQIWDYLDSAVNSLKHS